MSIVCCPCLAGWTLHRVKSGAGSKGLSWAAVSWATWGLTCFEAEGWTLSTLVEECLEALVSDKGGREGMTSEGGVREVGQLF